MFEADVAPGQGGEFDRHPARPRGSDHFLVTIPVDGRARLEVRSGMARWLDLVDPAKGGWPRPSSKVPRFATAGGLGRSTAGCR